MPPKVSAFARKRLGEQIAGWDQSVELQAAAVDVLQVILRTLQVANLQDPPTGDIPRVPRPYEPEVEPETGASLADLNDFLKE